MYFFFQLPRSRVKEFIESSLWANIFLDWTIDFKFEMVLDIPPLKVNLDP